MSRKGGGGEFSGQVGSRISSQVGDHWNRVGRLPSHGAGPVRYLEERSLDLRSKTERQGRHQVVGAGVVTP